VNVCSTSSSTIAGSGVDVAVSRTSACGVRVTAKGCGPVPTVAGAARLSAPLSAALSWYSRALAVSATYTAPLSGDRARALG
jgi:hypothetical protein